MFSDSGLEIFTEMINQVYLDQIFSLSFFFIPSFFLLNNKFSSARNYCIPKRKLAIVLT